MWDLNNVWSVQTSSVEKHSGVKHIGHKNIPAVDLDESFAFLHRKTPPFLIIVIYFDGIFNL